jgi:hypothetical protein
MNYQDEPLRSPKDFEAALEELHALGDRLLFEESFDAWKASWLDSWAFGFTDVDDSDAFRMLLHNRLEHLELVAQRFYRMDYEALVSTIMQQANIRVVWTLDRTRGSCEPSVLLLHWSRHETVTQGSSTWSLQAFVRLSLGVLERPAFGGFTPPFSNRGPFWLECEAHLCKSETTVDEGPPDDAFFKMSEVRKLREAFQAEPDSGQEEQNTPPELTILNAEQMLENWGADVSLCPALISVAANWAREQLRQCTPRLNPGRWPNSEQQAESEKDEAALPESVQLAVAELYELDRLLQAQPDLPLGSLSESSAEASTVNAYLRFSDSDIVEIFHDVSSNTLRLASGVLWFPAVLPPRNHHGGTRGRLAFKLDEYGTATLSSDGTRTEQDISPTQPTGAQKQQSEAELRLPGISSALRRLLSYELLAATTSSDLFETVWSERDWISAHFPESFVVKPPPHYVDDLPF